MQILKKCKVEHPIYWEINVDQSYFNNVIENKLNEKILKAAVEQFVMGLVFDLLSGCNSKLISAIIQPNVATAITPLVEHAQKVKSGEIADGLASAVNTTVDATIQEAP